MRISGTDEYEWVPGGFFLIHRVDVRMGDDPVNAIEIIGYDASTGAYLTHAFDSQGSVSTFQMSEQNGVWTLSTPTQRATLRGREKREETHGRLGAIERRVSLEALDEGDADKSQLERIPERSASNRYSNEPALNS